MAQPVMFVVYIGSILTTAIWLAILTGQTDGAPPPLPAVSLWLWFTVLFASRGSGPKGAAGGAESLKGPRNQLGEKNWRARAARRHRESGRRKPAQGDIVLVEAGDTIRATKCEGGASLDESAITGESAPVIRSPAATSPPGHRRHPRAVRLAGGAVQRQPGNLPRSRDRHGGRRQTQNAE